MGIPTLVLIDLQKDFYAPGGSYDRAGRPLDPIRQTIQKLVPLTHAYPNVIRIQSIYRAGQFSDMPDLCREGSVGTEWHPKLEIGRLLTKRKHSGFSVLSDWFDSAEPLILAGVCTHRCVRSTFEDARARGWDVRILEEGVASCGYRRDEHLKTLNRWKKEEATIPINALIRLLPQKSQTNPEKKRTGTYG